MGPASVGVCWVRVAWLERNLRHPREAAAARWTGQGPPGSRRPFRPAPPGPPSPSTGPHSGARSCLQIRVTQGREEGAAGSGHRLAPHSQEGPIKDNRAAILLAGGHSAAAPFVAGKLRNPSFSGVPSGRSPCPHGHFTPDWPDPRPGRRCLGEAAGAAAWAQSDGHPQAWGPPQPHLDPHAHLATPQAQTCSIHGGNARPRAFPEPTAGWPCRPLGSAAWAPGAPAPPGRGTDSRPRAPRGWNQRAPGLTAQTPRLSLRGSEGPGQWGRGRDPRGDASGRAPTPDPAPPARESLQPLRQSRSVTGLGI